MSLQAKNLSYMLGNKFLFRNLNFKLVPGQLIMIQGQNGAGKTTLLKILAGLMLARKGEVCWANESMTESINYREACAYLGHHDGIHLELSVIENIKLQATLNQCVVDQKALQSILATFSLQNKICQYLSAGQRRKVGLSAMLLKNKPLWILDEPYTALDKQSITLFNDYLHQHLASGKMVVMASHIPFENAHQVINL